MYFLNDYFPSVDFRREATSTYYFVNPSDVIVSYMSAYRLFKVLMFFVPTS